MKISKDFEFAAAHRLKLPYDSPCKNFHGHNYKLKVTLHGGMNECGMIMDFKELKAIVNREVISKLDHQDLSTYFEDGEGGYFNPTAEIMSEWIFHRLFLNGLSQIYSVTLWETTDSSAEYP